jgi:AhpD family alkylhydroperoxidase
MRESLGEFRRHREKMNEKILASGNLQIQRFFNLHTRTYETGALSAKVKELLGLVASLVLRCDDYITYHMPRCMEENVSDEELFEALSVALVVGGSITIPEAGGGTPR